LDLDQSFHHKHECLHAFGSNFNRFYHISVYGHNYTKNLQIDCGFSEGGKTIKIKATGIWLISVT
jgi:hypothetical protein